MTYSEKLNDVRWKTLREAVLENRGRKCEWCGESETILNIHHNYYLKGREPWEYDISDLACLCKSCHYFHHKLTPLEAHLWFAIVKRDSPDFSCIINHKKYIIETFLNGRNG